jgi:hypothetical protein
VKKLMARPENERRFECADGEHLVAFHITLTEVGFDQLRKNVAKSGGDCSHVVVISTDVDGHGLHAVAGYQYNRANDSVNCKNSWGATQPIYECTRGNFKKAWKMDARITKYWDSKLKERPLPQEIPEWDDHSIDLAFFPATITTTKKRLQVKEDQLLKKLLVLLDKTVPNDITFEVHSNMCASKKCGFEYFVKKDLGDQNISGLLKALWVAGENGMVWDIVYLAIDNVRMSSQHKPEKVQEYLKSIAQGREKTTKKRKLELLF